MLAPKQASWDYKIDVAEILHAASDDPSAEEVAGIVVKILAALSSSLPEAWLDVRHKDYDATYDEVVDSLMNLTAEPLTAAAHRDRCDPADVLDEALEALCQ
ncbi:hypothetical protein [Comamonas thiooxydans]|uniref:hypothetical protein n=1 Tax=Comamonas thiooxydans TaxID=363952 RepID=UPI000B411A7C|nr:hypothetical protein [Comamonas thiooxydans]